MNKKILLLLLSIVGVVAQQQDMRRGGIDITGITNVVSTNGFIFSVNTWNDLKALSVAGGTNLVVEVKGRISRDDGGGGIFNYNPASVSADDSGTIATPNAGGGAWFRQYSGTLNLLWFGAKGDGITDDTTAIQSAITACPAGGSVFVPGQHTFVVDTVAWNKSLTMFGGGGFLHLAGEYNFPIFTVGVYTDILTGVAGGTNFVTVSFKDITFDSNCIANTNLNINIWKGAAIYLVNGYKQGIFQDCVFTNVTRCGIYAAGPVTADRCTFVNMSISDGVLNHICMGGIFGSPVINGGYTPAGDSQIKISNCRFLASDKSLTSTNNPGGIFITRNSAADTNFFSLSVRDSLFDGVGMDVAGNFVGQIHVYFGASYANISGCTFTNIPYSGIKMQNTEVFKISNNTFGKLTNSLLDITSGIAVEPFAHGDTRQTVNGIISGNSFDGIMGYGVLVSAAANVLVDNNMFRGGGLCNSVAFDINATGTNIQVIGNVLVDPPYRGIQFNAGTNCMIINNRIANGAASSAQYGILLANGFDNYMLNNEITWPAAGGGLPFDIISETRLVRFLNSTGDSFYVNTDSGFSMLATSPAALSSSGTGSIYFDSGVNKFKVSENGGAYVNLVSAGGTISGLTTGVMPYASSATALADSPLSRLDANTLEQRNGVNAQRLSIYNTYTDASNYERAGMFWSGNIFQIGDEKAGTGGFRSTKLFSTSGASLTLGANAQFAGMSSIITVGNVIPNGDAIDAIGSSAKRYTGFYGLGGRATAQTAANASVFTKTLSAADGTFVISANVNVTTSSGEAFTVQVAYTDETNTARTLIMPFVLLAGTTSATIAFANGAVPYEGVPCHIRCKASTSITGKTQAAGTYTGCTFNVEFMCNQIQ